MNHKVLNLSYVGEEGEGYKIQNKTGQHRILLCYRSLGEGVVIELWVSGAQADIFMVRKIAEPIPWRKDEI